jgi:hypothetical protein
MAGSLYWIISKRIVKNKRIKNTNIIANTMTEKKHRIYTMVFGKVYPFYIAKAQKKNRTKQEVDQIIKWLTGYTQKGLEKEIQNQSNFEEFFANAPKLHPNRNLVTGVICGIRIENIKDPLMKELRILDKLVDELAKGRSMEKILRTT